MDLTTLDRVKLTADSDPTLTTEDALFSQLITSVSAGAERYMRREAQTASRNQLFTHVVGSKVLWLPAWPVTSVAVVYYAGRPSDTTLPNYMLSMDSYGFNPDTGILRFFRTMSLDPGYLRVTWTGGMAADTATFIVEFPDIAEVIDRQVVYEWQRRKSAGAAAVTTQTGSKTFSAGAELNLLENTRMVLDAYSRTTW